MATIHSTDIDREAGLLRLTTFLAHSSGEWISSEWPVCQIIDIASAQRMGAALAPHAGSIVNSPHQRRARLPGNLQSHRT
jgi:hypothetical protein